MTAPTPEYETWMWTEMGRLQDALAAVTTERDRERDRADRWAAQVHALENVLDNHSFDDEHGNGFVPIGPLQGALNGKEKP